MVHKYVKVGDETAKSKVVSQCKASATVQRSSFVTYKVINYF